MLTKVIEDIQKTIQAIGQEFYLDFHDRKLFMFVNLPTTWEHTDCLKDTYNLCGAPVHYTTENTVEIFATTVGKDLVSNTGNAKIIEIKRIVRIPQGLL